MLDVCTLCCSLGNSGKTVGHGGSMSLRVKATLAIFIAQPDLNFSCLNDTAYFSSNDSLNGEEP